MSQKEVKLVLVFKDDIVATLTPVTEESEKTIEKLLDGMIIQKSKVWCG